MTSKILFCWNIFCFGLKLGKNYFKKSENTSLTKKIQNLNKIRIKTKTFTNLKNIKESEQQKIQT